MNSLVGSPQRFRIIDSHTGGEPTRVILDGGPEVPMGPVSMRRRVLAEEHDYLRRALCLEPRGNEHAVGAVLYPSDSPQARAAVIFFNNSGYLDMCVHGLIGIVHSMSYAGLVAWGSAPIAFETPAGLVQAQLLADGEVEVSNVRSFRWRAGVEVQSASGWIRGDVAYGGNWFFIVHHEEHRRVLEYANVEELTELGEQLREALASAGVTGPAGEAIDHIQLTSPSPHDGVDARNFVLCPGGAYDRSPCGTGSSARLACLVADGCVSEGQTWVQESIVGSRFHLAFTPNEGGIIPRIRGRAHIISDGHTILDPHDPYRAGFLR